MNFRRFLPQAVESDDPNEQSIGQHRQNADEEPEEANEDQISRTNEEVAADGWNEEAPDNQSADKSNAEAQVDRTDEQLPETVYTNAVDTGHVEEVETTIKITDVNNDCLGFIFVHLELIDLLNVIEANKYLKPAAIRVCTEKYRKIIIDIQVHATNRGSPEILSNGIWVTNKTDALKLMRCFGTAISQIKISYSPSTESDDAYFIELERYIEEYCGKPVLEIQFTHSVSSVPTKLAASVESVCFYSCELNREQCQIDKWYPNVRRLSFGSMVEIDDVSRVLVKYPHLTSLTVERVDPIIQSGLNESNVMEILRLNPNLKSLNLHNFDTKFLQMVGEYLQQLKHLELSFEDDDSFNHDEPSIRLWNVKKLDVSVKTTESTLFPNFPFNFGNIEEIRFTTDKCYINFHHDFFRENPLKIIHLNCDSISALVGNRNDLARFLPSVTELLLENCKLTVDIVISFLECPMLAKFHFAPAKSFREHMARNGFANEWRVEFDENVVKMERNLE